MITLTISKFKDKDNNNELTIAKQMAKGIKKICVKQIVETPSRPGWVGGEPQTLVGWIKILPQQFATLEEYIVEGADFNAIPGVDKLQLYTQLAFEPFYAGQDSAKKKAGDGVTLVPSLINGRSYYAQTEFAFADEEQAPRVWGKVVTKEGRKSFVADASVRDEQPAEAVATASAEGEF